MLATFEQLLQVYQKAVDKDYGKHVGPILPHTDC